MAKATFRVKNKAGGEPENVEFDAPELNIDKVTAARIDENGHWVARPENHRFTFTHRQKHGEGGHWLFSTAVASLGWSNQGKEVPEATFEMYRTVDVGVQEPIMTIAAKGLVVSHWSLAWSAQQQEISEHLELKAWQVTSMQSPLHEKVVESLLLEIGD